MWLKCFCSVVCIGLILMTILVLASVQHTAIRHYTVVSPYVHMYSKCPNECFNFACMHYFSAILPKVGGGVSANLFVVYYR